MNGSTIETPVARNRSASRRESANMSSPVVIRTTYHPAAGSVRPVPTPGFDRLLTEHFTRIRSRFPDDIRVWDAHTHLGVDEDGFTQTPEELLDSMRAQGVERSFMIAMAAP